MTRAASFRLGRRDPTGSLPGCRPRPPRTRLPRARPPRGRRRRPCRVSPSSSTPRSPPSAVRGATGRYAMAQAVRTAIASGEHLRVQAGTGTGKSLAYLVPAILHAVERGTGRRRDGDDRAAAPARRPRPAPRWRGARRRCSAARRRSRSSRAAATTCACNKLHGGGADDDERAAVRPLRGRRRSGRTVKRAPRVGRRHRDRRPRRARPRRARPALAAGVGQRPRVPGRRPCPYGDECFAEKARDAGRPGRRRRHQPRAARHRRARGLPRCCPSTTW